MLGAGETARTLLDEWPAGERPPGEDTHARLDRAVYGLARDHPTISARHPIRRWQIAVFVLLAVSLAATLVLPAAPVTLVATVMLSLPFTCVAVLRLLALDDLGPLADRPPIPAAALPQAELPRYTILVPLFREAGVVAQLVEGLLNLDYPQDRLQILFILESVDAGTIAAFTAHDLPAHMRLAIVPDGAPRTKPRALNYALTDATGEFVVVYDAEDLPEPDQLKRAVAAFAASPSRLGCLQARLNVYNPRAGWLVRQFAIEYTALFDAILPCLERLGLPVLLGGTSNHFPLEVLRQVGGWDPFNVTEDADLGIRLARFGWHVGVLNSTTWEEAPPDRRVWTGQRTRWLKGWMQTYLVHMREPAALLHDLGGRRFLGLQMLMGALLFSALVHPWFFILAAARIFAGQSYMTSLSGTGLAVLIIVAVNLIGGYAAAILLGRRAVARRHPGLESACWWMPLYWLAISLAAYRALIELALRPHHWEKTEHRGVGGEIR